jgi:hypothetical protein
MNLQLNERLHIQSTTEDSIKNKTKKGQFRTLIKNLFLGYLMNLYQLQTSFSVHAHSFNPVRSSVSHE